MSQPIPRRRRYHVAEAPIPAEIRSAVDGALAAIQPVRRDKALPLLQQIQARLGALPADGLRYASKQSRIPHADLNALVSFYDLLHTDDAGHTVIHVCDDVVCRCAPGAGAFLTQMQELGHTIHTAPCLGQCDRGPAALSTAASDTPTLAYGGFASWSLLTASADTSDARKAWPDGHTPLLLARCGRYHHLNLNQYAQLGGLTALQTARFVAPADIIALVKSSKLVGRGGAAFPTGIKWEGVANAPTPLGQGPDGALKYVVVNADESEPGTFTNRVLMEEDPLAVIESALIAAYAVGAQQIYIYIRGEYPLAIERINEGIEVFRRASLLGGTNIEVRVGAGAYVCGEETALFASIEGERGEPRVKPPFPTTNGLFGRPTLINNVETLQNLLPIISIGADKWNAAIPKLFSISGHVAKPGVYELPIGRPLSDLIELAGGPIGEIQAVLMGGASGMFIGPELLHTPLDFKPMADAGATLGSGAVMLFNTDTDLWDIAKRAARFFASESCGKCVPCRVGTARQVDLVGHLADGALEWLPLHEELGQAMADASICGLGQTATNAVRSLVKLKGGA